MSVYKKMMDAKTKAEIIKAYYANPNRTLKDLAKEFDAQITKVSDVITAHFKSIKQRKEYSFKDK